MAKEGKSDFILSLVLHACMSLTILMQVNWNLVPVFFSYCQPDLSLRKEIKANATSLCYHFYMLPMC